MLFELMLVITLVALCASIGFMAHNATQGASFASDIAMIRLLFHTAATRAACVKKEQEIVFDTTNSQFVFDGQKYPLGDGYYFGTMPDVYGPPSAPSKLVTQPISFVDKKARAYTDGTLQAGTLYITNSREQYAITTPVSAFSYIRAYKYTKKVWQKIS